MLFAKFVSVHSVLQTRRKQGSAVVILMALYQEQTVVQQAMLSSGIKMMYTGLLHSLPVDATKLCLVPAAATLILCRRMDFSVKCAYAHGTSAVRTHLINMAPKQIQLTWPCFKLLKEKWKGKVHWTSNVPPLCPALQTPQSTIQ